MTWSSEDGGSSAYNIEFPSVRFDLTSLTARLEFNWIARSLLPSSETSPEVLPSAASIDEPVRIIQVFSGFNVAEAPV
jgi:hypothetical protein